MAESDQLSPPSAAGSPAKRLPATPTVLAKTEHWLVVDKPAGWLSIPGRASPASRADGPRVVSEWAGAEHGPVWVVHRLDRETSGVLLFARSAEAHRLANGWFAAHEVRKGYDLLAAGAMNAPVERVAVPIEGARSVTQVELKSGFAGCFLARAVPLTGRRHQIRIHLASRGTPILGDSRYGGPESVDGASGLRIERVALHAARLQLPTREVFEAPWPADFSAWVERLRAPTQAVQAAQATRATKGAGT